MTAYLAMIAALAIGVFIGCLLTAIYTQAKISRSQERMQRKVLYWQEEARRWRAEVERQSRKWPGVAQPPLDLWGG